MAFPLLFLAGAALWQWGAAIVGASVVGVLSKWGYDKLTEKWQVEELNDILTGANPKPKLVKFLRTHDEELSYKDAKALAESIIAAYAEEIGEEYTSARKIERVVRKTDAGQRRKKRTRLASSSATP